MIQYMNYHLTLPQYQYLSWAFYLGAFPNSSMSVIEINDLIDRGIVSGTYAGDLKLTFKGLWCMFLINNTINVLVDERIKEGIEKCQAIRRNRYTVFQVEKTSKR